MSPSALSLRALSFRYRGADREALRDVALEVGAGETAVVLGASGAGKSTLLGTLNGVVPAFLRGELGGEIVRFGTPQGPAPPAVAALSREVATVFQDFESQLFATEVALEVAFGPENHGIAPEEIAGRVRAALAVVGLEGFESRRPSELSGGEKQRLAIAAALALEPRLLVLDEPTTDLDPVGKARVLEVLGRLGRERGTAVVIAEHETEELAVADRALLLEDGAVARSGTAAAVLGDGEALEARGVRAPQVPMLLRRLGVGDGAEGAGVAEAARMLAAAGHRVDPERAAALAAADPPAPGGPPLIEVERLTHRYAGAPPGAPPALAGVDLEVRAGEFLALLGANGSGKSTLARHWNGLLAPETPGARIAFRGRDVASLPRGALAREVGYVFQNPDHQIFCATVEEEVAFGPRNFGLDEATVGARVRAALETVSLGGYGGRDPFALTKGERQRVAVASVLAMDPAVLVLDEPTTGLDHRDQRRMMDLLRRLNGEGRTVIIITHHIWVALEYARRIVLLAGGRIVRDGPVREVIADREALAAARVTPPPVVRLGLEMGAAVRSRDELERCLTRAAGGGAGAGGGT